MEKRNNLYLTLSIILSALVLLLGGFIVYDKVFRKNESSDNINSFRKCENINTKCECSDCPNSSLEEKVTNLKRIELTNVNQEINIDGKKFKIKNYITVDGLFLTINDSIQEALDTQISSADFVYVTDKYAIFTVNAQDWETITYAIDKTGAPLSINSNSNDDPTGEKNGEYQMHDFKIVDGYLHASGHVFCGLDGDCPDKDLLIKFIDNALIVTEAK